jgi:ABC-type multidrug transport system fused ATPase/permease subunit
LKAFDLLIFKKILGFVKPYKKLLYTIVLISIILSVFTALRPYLLKQTVDLYINNKDQSGLQFYVLLMALALFVEVLSQYFFTYLSNVLGQKTVFDMRQKMYHILSSKTMTFYDQNPVGQMVTRLVSDTESIARIFSQGLFMIIKDLLVMVVVVIFMFYMNWKLSWIVLLSMPFLLYATRIFQIKMKSAFENVRTYVSNLNTFIQERLSGMKIVQVFTREQIEYDNFVEINRQHRDAWIKTIWYNSIFFPVADFLSTITLASIIWYGGVLILNQSQVTSIGDLFAYTMLISMLFNPLRQIADKFNELQMGVVAGKRVFKIIEEPDEIEQSGQKIISQLKGEIEFKDVWFAYKEEQWILKDFSLKIPSKKTTAIVGSTGSGKSTIVQLITKFYAIQKGAILLDDVSIQTINNQSLRNHIGLVLQDVYLFSDTIYNNVVFFDQTISREKVIEAAQTIGIHDFIMSLPDQYDYFVSERGVLLSTGQRQLIAFLRIYLTNPEILILDEATSSIDTYAEEMIQHATKIITQNRTSIIIAHRLSTIINADYILYLENGEISESGNHHELLEKDGKYKKLFESQFVEL